MHYPRLDRSLVAAANWHAGVEREGDAPLPYFCHPMEVLVGLRYTGGVTDEDLLCAAILHDTIEESSATLDDIESIAGSRVRDLVRELTRREPTRDETQGLSKPQVWALRSQLLLDEIGRMSHDARQVKLADRLSNIREAKLAKRAEKLERYLRQTRQILEIVPREVNVGLWDAIWAELA